MTDWREHDGGPQPVDDDVWVQTDYDGDIPTYGWENDWDYGFRYRILNQHLIDAARLEGIRLGLEAAEEAAHEYADRCRKEGYFDAAIAFATHAEDLRALNPDTIAREAVLDQLTSEAQADNMGYDNEPR